MAVTSMTVVSTANMVYAEGQCNQECHQLFDRHVVTVAELLSNLCQVSHWILTRNACTTV